LYPAERNGAVFSRHRGCSSRCNASSAPIPVLVCSGYVAEKGADKSLEGFRFSALSKPFRPEALLTTVRSLLAPPQK